MSFIFMVFTTSPQMQEVLPVKVSKQRGHETEVALNPWPRMPANQHIRTNALRSNNNNKKLKNNQSQAVNQVSSIQATV